MGTQGSFNDAPLQRPVPPASYDEIGLILHYEGIQTLERELVKKFERFTGFKVGPLINKFTVARKFRDWEISALNSLSFHRLLQESPGQKIYNVVSGTHHAFHSTIMEGLFKGNNPIFRAQVFEALRHDREVVYIQKNLIDDRMTGWLLALDRYANVLLVRPEGKTTDQARHALAKIYLNHGLEPIWNSIDHCTVARPYLFEGHPIVYLEYIKEMKRRVDRYFQETYGDPEPVPHLYSRPEIRHLQRALYVDHIEARPSLELMMHTHPAA
jgi:hypothetical protein